MSCWRIGLTLFWAAALGCAGCATKSTPIVQAASAPPAAATNTLAVECALTVKGGTLAELRRSMRAAQTCFSANVQPFGLRLFDLPQAGLTYDRARQEIQVRLNQAVCARHPAALTGAVARVAVCSLDCVLFFEVDTAAGTARQMERYEVDYVLSAKAGAPFSQWQEIRLRINDQPADWDLFTSDGLHFDWLPPVLTFKIEGRDATGQPCTVDVSHKNQTLQALFPDARD